MSKTMIVIKIAMTPSLKASRRCLRMRKCLIHSCSRSCRSCILLGSRPACGKPWKRQQFRVALACQIPRIRGDITEMIDTTGGPADLDRTGAIALTQPEMQSRVARRLVAASALARDDLAPAERSKRHPCAHGVPIGFRAFEANGQIMADAFRLVVEVSDGLILREDQGVDAAVVVEIAGGQAAADALNLPGRRRLLPKYPRAGRQDEIHRAGQAVHRGNTACCRAHGHS